MELRLFLILLILLVIVSITVWRQYKDIQLIKTVTSTTRGESSERDVIIRLLKMGINPRAIFHDCYIRKSSSFSIKNYYWFILTKFLGIRVHKMSFYKEENPND